MGEDPRIYASKEIGRKVVNHIIDRLSELAYRLLNRTEFLDRSKYIRALKVQVLTEARSKGKKDTQFGKQRIRNFHPTLMDGKYYEAIKEGEKLVLKTRESRIT